MPCSHPINSKKAANRLLKGPPHYLSMNATVDKTLFSIDAVNAFRVKMLANAILAIVSASLAISLILLASDRAIGTYKWFLLNIVVRAELRAASRTHESKHKPSILGVFFGLRHLPYPFLYAASTSTTCRDMHSWYPSLDKRCSAWRLSSSGKPRERLPRVPHTLCT